VEEFEPGLRRLALRALAERASGRPVVLDRARAAEILRLAQSPEGGEVELGLGLVASCESGFIRFLTGEQDAAPQPVALRLPGRARIGDWEVRAELHPAPVDPAGPDVATLDAEALAGRIEVRTWRPGDRIRPLGMKGSKTLGDLFTDRGVPRSLRPTLPVITVDGEIAWVAGVAVADGFRLDPRTEQVAVLTARALE
jgi:tRNA(Ile)-lysidine synthase